MLDKPDIDEKILIQALQEHYGIAVQELEFLPLGHDAMASVYRAEASTGQVYFLKLKQGTVHLSSLAVPYFLQENGLEQIVAPIAAKNNELAIALDDYKLIVYPFIEGESGMEIGLSDAQWVEYGKALKGIHSAQLPNNIANDLRNESFIPTKAELLEKVCKAAQENDFSLASQQDIAEFILARYEEIIALKDRQIEIGQMLQKQSPEFVLCHADIHTANVLIDTARRLHVVDWDEALFAPKERDLMFISGNTLDGKPITSHEDALFYEGYGATEINRLAMAYYRYDWAVQDIAEFGKEVFFMDDLSEATKEDSARLFKNLFEKGWAVDLAYQADRDLCS